jgi:methyl-accepting chemotaxis protein
MDGSLETIEAVRSTREAADRVRRWRLAEWLGRIGTRATMISILILVVVGLLAGNALTALSRQSQIIDELGVRLRMTDDAAASFAASVAAYGSAFAGALTGVTAPNAIAARLVPQTAQLAAAFRSLEQLLEADVDPAVIAGAREMLARLPGLAERTQQAFSPRRRADLAPLHEEWLEAQAGFIRLIDAARDASRLRAEAGLVAARRVADEARAVAIAGLGLGVAATILVWIVLVAMITRPITALSQSMVLVARGDVAAPVPFVEREDQLGFMARAVRVFRDNLNVTRSLADRALEGAGQTVAGTARASEAISRMAAASSAQLADLRALAASLSDITEAVGQAARGTLDARDRTGDAKLVLDDAIRRLGGLLRPGDGASQGTEGVARIADGIARLATQAGILAINAQIESLREGSHTQGLAVVAEDMRQLADGTESLAAEIADVLRAADRRPLDDRRMAETIGIVFERLDLLVAESARRVTGVSAALDQQHEALQRLGERLGGLARTGETNATEAGRLTGALAELAGLAAEARAAVEAVAGGAQLGRNA